MFSRKELAIVVGAAMALFVAAGCSVLPPQVASAGGGASNQPAGPLAQVASPSPRGITVIGQGKASGAPDVANVSIGVQTQSTNVQQAVADNATQMTRLLGALKANGIADKDIGTSNYSVYTENPSPVPGGKGGTGDQIIYHVNNQVDVMVRDVTKLGDVLDKVIAAGANNINGVSFSVADPAKLEQEARANAMADAKNRAAQLALLAGASLGDVQTISEASSGPGPIAYSMPMAAGMGGGVNTPIQPGSLDVSMSVQVTYAIK